MEILPIRSWKHEFARSADADRYRDTLRRAHDETRKKDREDKAEQGASAEDAIVAVLATEVEIAEFEITLDHYDAATYDALIENGRLLDIVRQEREAMFEKAFELPDGRRVFETEDGLHVFDEHGSELDAAEISPDDIEDWRPKWEQVLESRRAEQALLDDREQIGAYQTELDVARQRLEDGDVTEAELKALERKLAEEMPDSVCAQLAPEHRPSVDGPATDVAATPETPPRPAANLGRFTFD